jgi:hypothetical protein
MKQETPHPHKQISQERDQKHCIMALANTVQQPFDAEIHKEQVGKGVDDFSGVDGCIVVLGYSSQIHGMTILTISNF